MPESDIKSIVERIESGEISLEKHLEEQKAEIDLERFTSHFSIEVNKPQLSLEARMSIILSMLSRKFHTDEMFIYFPEQGFGDRLKLTEAGVKEKMETPTYKELLSGEKSLAITSPHGHNENVVLSLKIPVGEKDLDGILYFGDKKGNLEYSRTEVALISGNIREMIKNSIGNSFKAGDKDSLTKLYRREQFSRLLKGDIAQSLRTKRDFSILMIDLDDFKPINDTYGHNAGDFVLAEASRAIRESIREGDTACRWGGEEFVVALPSTDIEGAAVVAEKIRQQMSRINLSYFYEYVYATDKAGKILSKEEYYTALANDPHSVEIKGLSKLDWLSTGKYNAIKRQIFEDEFNKSKDRSTVGRETLTASIGLASYPYLHKGLNESICQMIEENTATDKIDAVNRIIIETVINKEPSLAEEYAKKCRLAHSSYKKKRAEEMSPEEQIEFMSFALVYYADRALYTAKRAGKNCIIRHE